MEEEAISRVPYAHVRGLVSGLMARERMRRGEDEDEDQDQDEGEDEGGGPSQRWTGGDAVVRASVLASTAPWVPDGEAAQLAQRARVAASRTGGIAAAAFERLGRFLDSIGLLDELLARAAAAAADGEARLGAAGQAEAAEVRGPPGIVRQAVVVLCSRRHAASRGQARDTSARPPAIAYKPQYDALVASPEEAFAWTGGAPEDLGSLVPVGASALAMHAQFVLLPPGADPPPKFTACPSAIIRVPAGGSLVEAAREWLEGRERHARDIGLSQSRCEQLRMECARTMRIAAGGCMRIALLAGETLEAHLRRVEHYSTAPIRMAGGDAPRDRVVRDVSQLSVSHAPLHVSLDALNHPLCTSSMAGIPWEGAPNRENAPSKKMHANETIFSAPRPRASHPLPPPPSASRRKGRELLPYHICLYDVSSQCLPIAQVTAASHAMPRAQRMPRRRRRRRWRRSRQRPNRTRQWPTAAK